MAKLTEMFDPTGWCVSKGGNKTRVKKSFYFQNQHKYISPWFQNEIQATEWFNKYVLRNRKPEFPSTLTLYEITRDVKSDMSSKQEDVLKRIVSGAYETKVIKQSDIREFIEPILKEKGEEAKKQFYKTLEEYGIKIHYNLKEQYIAGPCPKCGSERITSGINSKTVKWDKEAFSKMSQIQKKEYMKDFVWMHKCLDCGEIQWTNTPVKIYEMAAAGHGEMMVQEKGPDDDIEDEPDHTGPDGDSGVDEDDKVKFHFDQDMYLQEGDYSDLEPSDYKEEQDISNLISYYIKIFGVHKDKIKSAIERSKNPLKQKVLFQLEKLDDDDLDAKLMEMSGVGGMAGFNASMGGSNDITVDNKNIRHRKKNKVIEKKL